MCVKKTKRYAEQNGTERTEYEAEISKVAPEDRVYVDESGVDQQDEYEYAWMRKGLEIIGRISGKYRNRTTVIAALNGHEVLAPIYFQGYTDRKVFEYWIERHLIKALKPGQTVIMDNASFHKSARIKDLIESVECKLLYLPAYSPDMNPIEPYWAFMKRQIKKLVRQQKNQQKEPNFFKNLTTVLNMEYRSI